MQPTVKNQVIDAVEICNEFGGSIKLIELVRVEGRQTYILYLAYSLTPVHAVAIPPVKSVQAPPRPSLSCPVLNPASCTLVRVS